MHLGQVSYRPVMDTTTPINCIPRPKYAGQTIPHDVFANDCGVRASASTSGKFVEPEEHEQYISFVMNDILQNCPSDEPLALINLKPENLKKLYLLGQQLIENGYREIFLFSIDPVYRLPQEDIDAINQEKEQLSIAIQNLYYQKWDTPLPCQGITYLPAMASIAELFPKNGSYAVLESPNEDNDDEVESTEASKLSLLGHSEEDRFANTIAFFPESMEKAWNTPPSLYSSRKKFVIDWSCKIPRDGKFILKFTGANEYLKSINMPTTQWFNIIKQKLENSLNEEIRRIRTNNSVKLTQMQRSILLRTVDQLFRDSFPNPKSYYITDNHLDRTEMFDRLFENTRRYERIFR